MNDYDSGAVAGSGTGAMYTKFVGLYTTTYNMCILLLCLADMLQYAIQSCPRALVMVQAALLPSCWWIYSPYTLHGLSPTFNILLHQWPSEILAQDL